MNTMKDNLRILLVDDDEDDRLIFCEVLESINEKITYEIATTGIEALEKLKNTPLPDIIFLDINMPILNGFECLTQIKDQKELKEIPVVMYSTAANEATIKTAYLLGAHSFFTKPNTHAEIEKRLKEILKEVRV